MKRLKKKRKGKGKIITSRKGTEGRKKEGREKHF